MIAHWTIFDLIWPLTGAIILLLLLAQRRLQKAAQPLRLEMAKVGEDLLTRENLPESVREDVEFCLDNAFDLMLTLIVCIVVFPVAVPLMLWGSRSIRSSYRDIESMSPENRGLYFEVLSLHQRITFANHPLLLLILELEALLFLPPVIFAAAIVRASMAQSVKQDLVITALEKRQAHFSRAHATAT